MSANRICFAIALIIFVLASVGAWPSIASDFEPLALGLAFMAAAHLV